MQQTTSRRFRGSVGRHGLARFGVASGDVRGERRGTGRSRKGYGVLPRRCKPGSGAVDGRTHRFERLVKASSGSLLDRAKTGYAVRVSRCAGTNRSGGSRPASASRTRATRSAGSNSTGWSGGPSRTEITQSSQPAPRAAHPSQSMSMSPPLSGPPRGRARRLETASDSFRPSAASQPRERSGQVLRLRTAG
jgi:hypothetical protein